MNQNLVDSIIQAIYDMHQFRDDCAIASLKGTFTSPIAASGCEKEYIAEHCYKMADAMMQAKFK